MKNLLAIDSIKSGPNVRIFIPFKYDELKKFLNVINNNTPKDIRRYEEYKVNCECKMGQWDLELKEICLTNEDHFYKHLTLTFSTESESIADTIRGVLRKDSEKYPLSKNNIRFKFTKNKKEYSYIPSEVFK